MTTRFQSIAPMPFGKFHLNSNLLATVSPLIFRVRRFQKHRSKNFVQGTGCLRDERRNRLTRNSEGVLEGVKHFTSG